MPLQTGCVCHLSADVSNVTRVSKGHSLYSTLWMPLQTGCVCHLSTDVSTTKAAPVPPSWSYFHKEGCSCTLLLMLPQRRLLLCRLPADTALLKAAGAYWPPAAVCQCRLYQQAGSKSSRYTALSQVLLMPLLCSLLPLLLWADLSAGTTNLLGSCLCRFHTALCAPQHVNEGCVCNLSAYAISRAAAHAVFMQPPAAVCHLYDGCCRDLSAGTTHRSAALATLMLPPVRVLFDTFTIVCLGAISKDVFLAAGVPNWAFHVLDSCHHISTQAGDAQKNVFERWCFLWAEAQAQMFRVIQSAKVHRLGPGETWESELVVRWFNQYWDRPPFENDMLPMPALRRQVGGCKENKAAGRRTGLLKEQGIQCCLHRPLCTGPKLPAMELTAKQAMYTLLVHMRPCFMTRVVNFLNEA
eukprot:scaffold101819_cov18-Tisochrysis_lutea.AAC.1